MGRRLELLLMVIAALADGLALLWLTSRGWTVTRERDPAPPGAGAA